MKSTNIYLIIFAVMLSCRGIKEDTPDSSGLNPEESFVFFGDFPTFDGSVSTKDIHNEGWPNKVWFFDERH